jgi:hypothetical protein
MRSFDENMDDELMNSDANLFLQHMSNIHFPFFVIESLIRIALLSFNISAIYITQVWAYIVAIALLLPMVFYEGMTLYDSLWTYLTSLVNLIDVATMSLALANHVVALSIGQNVMLAHWAVLFLYVRVIFSLRFIREIRQFLQILTNIVKGIIPFTIILLLFTLFTALDGFLAPNPENSSY